MRTDKEVSHRLQMVVGRKTARGMPIHSSFFFWIYRSRGDRELGAYHFLRQQKKLSRSLFFLPFLAERAIISKNWHGTVCRRNEAQSALNPPRAEAAD